MRRWPGWRRVLEPFQAFRAVFANPQLRRVELAWAGSETGKWLYILALSIFAYDAGGATAVGLVALIRTVPAAVGAPFMALLADRYPRERVMLGASLVRFAAVAGAAAVVGNGGRAVVVYVLAGVVTLSSTAFRPAQAAALPSLARTAEELTAANVASSTVATVASFVGPAVGGLLFAVTSTRTVFALTAVVFLVSALLVARVRPEREPERKVEPAGIARDAVAGFSAILAGANLRVLVGLYAAQAFVGGAFNVLLVVTALELLDLGQSGVGFLNAAFGVGGILGAVIALALVARRRLASDFMLGIALWGAPLMLIGIWPNAAVAIVLLGLIGIGETLVEVAGPTLLQRSVPDVVLARVFGALESLIVTMIGLGGLAAPALIALVGIRGALVCTGVLLPLLALVAWSRLLAIDRAHVEPRRELELLRGVPMFALLPDPSLEQLAAELRPVEARPGEVVIRQGERGDRFYIVSSGALDVTADGQSLGTLGPGDFFGEIALVRDVPRTAGVTARTDARLYALARDEFVAAVTGHAPSYEAAHAVVAARLGSLRPGAPYD